MYLLLMQFPFVSEAQDLSELWDVLVLDACGELENDRSTWRIQGRSEIAYK
jgi:hypothetical protein